MRDKTIDIGFAVITPVEELIEDDIRDDANDFPKFKDFVDMGYVKRSGEVTEEGWEELSRDIEILENNVVDWLREIFGSARGEGHDKDGAFVGTLWVNPNNQEQLETINSAEFINDNSVVLSFYALPNKIQEKLLSDLSSFGEAYLSADIEFFSLEKLRKYLD